MYSDHFITQFICFLLIKWRYNWYTIWWQALVLVDRPNTYERILFTSSSLPFKANHLNYSQNKWNERINNLMVKWFKRLESWFSLQILVLLITCSQLWPKVNVKIDFWVTFHSTFPLFNANYLSLATSVLNCLCVWLSL